MPGHMAFLTQGSEETGLKRPREPLLGTLLPGSWTAPQEALKEVRCPIRKGNGAEYTAASKTSPSLSRGAGCQVGGAREWTQGAHLHCASQGHTGAISRQAAQGET